MILKIEGYFICNFSSERGKIAFDRAMAE